VPRSGPEHVNDLEIGVCIGVGFDVGRSVSQRSENISREGREGAKEREVIAHFLREAPFKKNDL
jgi:hypothetical protein